MKLSEYYDQLRGHDWLYAYSDDHSVYRRGVENEKRLERIGHTSEQHAALFKAMQAHYMHMSGGERPALPERPQD